MLRKQKYYEKGVWPHWVKKFKASSHKLIFLPGIMGSELHDRKSNDTRWIDLDFNIAELEYEKLSPSGAIDKDNQFIFARDIVDPPFSSNDPYTELLLQLNPGIFCFDWRESIPIEAKRLHRFMELIVTQTDKVNFLTHSMGGCVLLYFLMHNSEFDDAIENIIFCTPSFHGALRPIRVIEEGSDTPLDDVFFVRKSTIQRSVATMPGLFQLLVAPDGSWPNELKLNDGSGVPLKHPIRASESLFNTGSWTNKYRPDLRSKLLKYARQYHLDKWRRIRDVVARLGEKITIIVGLNGKTLCCATRTMSRQWILHKVSAPAPGQISNGDGTVLLQSSLLPGLPTSSYWADVPPQQQNIHGDFMDRPNVLSGTRAILQSSKNLQSTGLIGYSDFIDKIDWSSEAMDGSDPSTTDNLDYIERANLRSLTPRQRWRSALNPGGRDAEMFYITREAAFRVLAGESLEAEAARIGQSPEFLQGHLRTLLMPILYS